MRGISQHKERLCNFFSSLTERPVPLEIISSCMVSFLDKKVSVIKPGGYKWGAVAASDIAELQHVAEKRKKNSAFFQLQKYYSSPDI